MWTSYSFYNLETVYFMSLQSWIEISLINWTVPPKTALFISHNGEGVGGLLASEKKKKVTMTEWGVVGMILTPLLPAGLSTAGPENVGYNTFF